MDLTVDLPSEGPAVLRRVIYVSMVVAILGILLLFWSGLLADLWKLDLEPTYQKWPTFLRP